MGWSSWLIKYPLADFSRGELGFLHPLRPELAVLAMLGIFAGVWWWYRREAGLEQDRNRRIALAVLRAAGLSLLALLLLGPLLRMRSLESSTGVVAVAIDVSKSMSLAADAGKATRLDRARQALAGNDGALARLAAAGEVRLYAFGSQLRPISPAQLPTLLAGDDNTRLSASLKELAQSASGANLDAVLLLTDGVDTTGADASAMARFAAGRGAVVHMVGYGEAGAAMDGAVTDVQHPAKAQAGALCDLAVAITRRGIPGPLVLKLYRDNTFLKDVEVPAGPDGASTVAVQFIPEGTGSQTYAVELAVQPGEKNTTNNRRVFRLDLEESRVEVLFVEGSPRHEYAFIRRTMADDRFFKVVTLLRLGKGRFYNSGDDSAQLTQGFPDSAEALGRFRAIILSDIEAGFFSASQINLISDFVRNRGGGLLMLGGVNSLSQGGYASSPIADLLPVSLAPGDIGAFDPEECQFKLTKDGAAHEILRLAANPAENISQWELMPTLKGSNPLYRAKPAAHVLAVRPPTATETRPAILLAVQDVGAGRVGVFASANSWRWKMLRAANDDTFRRYWSQMIRWLAVGSKELLTVETTYRSGTVGDPQTVTARVLDRAHRPANDAVVQAQIRDPQGNTEVLTLPWILSEDGVYQGVYWPRSRGDYTVTVEARLPSGTLEPRATAFNAGDASAEFTRPDMDATALKRVAEAGGGTCDLTGNVNQAVDAILDQARKRHVPVATVEERDLRDMPLLLLLLAGLWFGEWIVRRRKGLA